MQIQRTDARATKSAACEGCPTCIEADRRDENIARAHAATVTVICTNCGKAMTTAVGSILAARGAARCCSARKTVR